MTVGYKAGLGITPDLSVTMATFGVLYVLPSGSRLKHKTPGSHFLAVTSVFSPFFVYSIKGMVVYLLSGPFHETNLLENVL